MAFLDQKRGGGGFRALPISDINVTPFVDVMLVLLIIFMVTMPIASAGVDVDLPQNKSKQLASDLPPTEVTINATGQIFVGEVPVARADFGATLSQLAQSVADPTEARIFVRADKSLEYGFVMSIVSDISGAGFVKVAFLSDPSGVQLGAR